MRQFDIQTLCDLCKLDRDQLVAVGVESDLERIVEMVEVLRDLEPLDREPVRSVTLRKDVVRSGLAAAIAAQVPRLQQGLIALPNALGDDRCGTDETD